MRCEGFGARERALEDGIEALGDGELVALVLGTGHSAESCGCSRSTD
jgi:DNA repair protein RadC